MESFKEPDKWYRFDGLHVNLSKLSDEELLRFTQHHEARAHELRFASKAIQDKYFARANTAMEVAEFFGTVTPPIPEYDSEGRYLEAEV